MSLFPKFKLDPVANPANSANPEAEISNFSNFSRGTGLSEDELRELLEEDWTEVKDNPDILEAFAQAIHTRRMREQGIKPPHYTQKSTCAHCGPVWLWEGAPLIVQGCPWCFNRVKNNP